jgi:hypothetical protein
VHLARTTTNPDDQWVTQQARNLSLSGALEDVTFLIRDRDPKLVAGFDEVFRTEGVNVVQTPFRSPQAERFVRTARTECLDWVLILGQRQLDRVLRVYVDHYNTARPHRALGRQSPIAIQPPTPPPTPRATIRMTKPSIGTLQGALRVADELELRGAIGGPFTWRIDDGGPLLRHRAARSSKVDAPLLTSTGSPAEVLYRSELSPRSGRRAIASPRRELRELLNPRGPASRPRQA